MVTGTFEDRTDGPLIGMPLLLLPTPLSRLPEPLPMLVELLMGKPEVNMVLSVLLILCVGVMVYFCIVCTLRDHRGRDGPSIRPNTLIVKELVSTCVGLWLAPQIVEGSIACVLMRVRYVSVFVNS